MKSALFTISLILSVNMLSGQNDTDRKDRSFAINFLNETRYSLYKEISGLSDEQWNYRPAEDAWSIAQIAEHISIAENNLYGFVINKVVNSEPAPDKKIKYAGRDDQLISLLSDRTNKVQSPENARPSDVVRWSTPEDYILYFDNLRDRTTAYVENTPLDLRSYFSKFGPLEEIDALQWMIFIAGHTHRHILQIKEAKASWAKSEKSTITGSN